MNADAGNLPDMLREKVVQYCKSWHFSGADGPDVGPELAALVEADDTTHAALVRWADANDAARRANLLLGVRDDSADREYREAGDALLRVARTERTARAALVAKIGGKG